MLDSTKQKELCITCDIVQAGNDVATLTFFVPYWIYLTGLDVIVTDDQRGNSIFKDKKKSMNMNHCH